MTEDRPTPVPRSIVKRLFLSPEERRLRAAWRLLLHAGLMGILTVVVSLPVGVAAAVVAALQPSVSILESTPILLASSLASLVAITLATWLARRILDRRSFRSLGLQVDRHTLPDLVFGFMLTGLVMGVVYLAEWRLGWLQFQGWAWESLPGAGVLAGLLGSLALFVCVGFQEELFSRGYHLQNLAEGLNLPWAVLLSSAIFGVLHLANPHATWAAAAGILVAGYFLAYGWIRTRRLWLSIGLHIGWNFFEGTIFGFAVSGTRGFNLIRQTVAGPVWITGGLFGPEAGTIVLPAIALGAALIWAYTRRRTESTAGFQSP